MEILEVPYGGKLWQLLLASIWMSAGMVFLYFVITRDHSTSPAQRAFLWAFFLAGFLPASALLASLVVTLFVKHTLKLTTTEISAPRFGFSLRNTRVPMSSVQRVALASYRYRRSLIIYHNGGRLSVAESFMPSGAAFKKVLAAFGDSPGADSSFRSDS